MSSFKLHGLLALTAFTLGSCPLLAAESPAPATAASNQDAVNKWIGVLKSDASRKEKADACRELARVGTRDAIGVLAELLHNPELSHMARYALEPIPDPMVEVALRRALESLGANSPQVVGVIGSIGVRRDANAVPQLVKLLRVDNPEVVSAASRSLGSIGTSAAARALMEAWANTPAPRCYGYAEGLFRAAEALVAKGQQAEAIAIYDRLRRSQAPHQVRAGGLRGAILARGEEGLSLLRSALHDDELVMFDAALRTSMEIPGREVTMLLTQECDERQSADRKVLLLQELGRRADPVGVYHLQRMAKSATQPQVVRVAALKALPQIGAPEVLDPLLATLNDKDRAVSQAALAGLGGLQGAEVDAAVTRMMESNDTAKRLVGFDLAARRRMLSSLPILIKAAGAEDGKVRSAAFKRLGELATVKELPSLLDLLEQGRDVDAAEEAIAALGVRLEHPEECADPAIARLGNAKPASKAALLRVLAVFGGDKALASVCRAVEDPNSDVRNAAVRVLCDWKSDAAAAEVLKLAKSATSDTEKTLCLRSYLAWIRNSEQSMEKKLAACREASSLVKISDEQKLLVGVLGGIKCVEAIQAILPYLEVEATAEEAALAVVTISDQLLKGADAAKVAGQLVEPLQKVEKSQPSLAQRASGLAKQAQDKAGK